MTFKEYKKIYGKDGYCSLSELECIQEESNPRSFRAILDHWINAHYRNLDKLTEDF